MILIVIHKEDYTADFVIDKLNARQIPYFRFNCEDSLNIDISLVYNGRYPELSINGHHRFRSIWYRRTRTPLVQSEDKDEYAYLASEADAFMRNVFGRQPTGESFSPYPRVCGLVD
jgi:hypothetical protein